MSSDAYFIASWSRCNRELCVTCAAPRSPDGGVSTQVKASEHDEFVVVDHVCEAVGEAAGENPPHLAAHDSA